MPYVIEDNLTDVVLERWNDLSDPRLRQIMQSLIKHLHGFLRDVSPDAGGKSPFALEGSQRLIFRLMVTRTGGRVVNTD